jgi:hypothetical protein
LDERRGRRLDGNQIGSRPHGVQTGKKAGLRSARPVAVVKDEPPTSARRAQRRQTRRRRRLTVAFILFVRGA